MPLPPIEENLYTKKLLRFTQELHILSSQRKEGDSNPRYPNRVRQFSKLVVSATHPSFLTEQLMKYFSKRVVQM